MSDTFIACYTTFHCKRSFKTGENIPFIRLIIKNELYGRKHTSCERIALLALFGYNINKNIYM